MVKNSDGRPTAVASHEQTDDADKSSGNLKHRQRNCQKGWNSNTTTGQELKFEGQCEDLTGHIHDCVVAGQITEVSRVFLSVFHLEVEIQVVTTRNNREFALKLTACSTNDLLTNMQYTLR